MDKDGNLTGLEGCRIIGFQNKKDIDIKPMSVWRVVKSQGYKTINRCAGFDLRFGGL